MQQDTNTPTEEQSLNDMDIPTRKKEAEELAAAFGYNTQSLSLDVINVQDAYVRGYAKCYKTLAQDNKLLKDRVRVLEELERNFYMDICRAYNAGKDNLGKMIRTKNNDTFVASHDYFVGEFPTFKTNVP